MSKNKNRIFTKLLIAGIVLTLCLTAIQIGAFSVNDSNEKQIQPRCTFKKIQSKLPEIKELSSTNPILNLGAYGTDVLIIGNGDAPFQNPTITFNGGQEIMLGFESWPDPFTLPDPYFTYSTDGGNTWSDNVVGWGLNDIGYTTLNPVIDYAGDRGGFGSVLPYAFTDWATFNFPDITNPDLEDHEWIANTWLASAMMEEWHSCDVCGVNSQYAPSEDALGIAIWTGDTLDGGTNGLWYGWETAAGQEFTVYPEEADPGFTYEADQGVNDVDLSTGMYYQAFYIFDDAGSTPYQDGVLIRSVQLDGTDGWVETFDIKGHIPGATNPDIIADDGNCYIVYEVNGGIGCFYSNNNGASFQSTNIVTDGQFPSVSAVGENVVVVYTRNGNLYNSISEDGGATWMESSTPVNDEAGTVPEQLHTADAAGTSIVWTDNRNGENSIFFDRAEITVPIIEIDSISGGMGVSAVVKNSGTAEATDIDWSITLDGGAFVGGETTGTIASLGPGDTATIESSFIIGLGATTITVTAGSASEQVSGTVLLFFILGL